MANSNPLSDLFSRARPMVERELQNLTPPYTLFFSVSDGKQRAKVCHASGQDLRALWLKLANQSRKLLTGAKIQGQWLRIDWVTDSEPMNWAALLERFKNTKRGYFRYGLALDSQRKVAFLEQELNGNAMLYGGSTVAHVVVNESQFRSYTDRRFGPNTPLNFTEEATVEVLHTKGIFLDRKTNPQLLYGPGRNAGRRVIEALDEPIAFHLVDTSSRYLASQVLKNGRFEYGWHCCFDRAIGTYNTLRHASSTYAMTEGWEVTRDQATKRAIDRALAHLTEKLIKKVQLPSGEEGAFLVEANGEIKLGGNAVCLLALVKYCELTGSDNYDGLMEQLALGIRFMQDQASGKFVHVLQYPELTLKEEFRIIYYDGEAAFGLMRLYGLTKDERWLNIVEKAFEYFIANNHWQAHDHWLSYCVNELTLYRPSARYYQFGIQNVIGHLDFIIERITTFPTLLELMMAAERMVSRLRQEKAFSYLLNQLDLPKFYRALHTRAMYLLNGYFWPEYAMYFKNPEKIVGSFYIRHHAFRVRIDDVEHYLSGFVAYRKYLLENEHKISKSESKNLPYIESETNEIMFAKVKNFHVDIKKLQQQFNDNISNEPSTPYRDNNIEYIGWAVTSRDGSLNDGVRRISSNDKNNKRGKEKTKICNGYLNEVLQSIKSKNLQPYRARIMQLKSNGKEMPFHVDEKKEAWRLHIPINTNPESYFEWRRKDGSIERVHLPADGSAWLVRVDVEHRATNLDPDNKNRVHLLMGLNEPPKLEQIKPLLLVNKEEPVEMP
ncbi:hypothetical protein [Microbulbifer sp. ALW1]|uniref:hypothetical protein n=1 Tax=Microbulbifer sp. (strain ALW1) TaxID=1516059 RepID=UPI0019122932|nr:hypothetical protein [Microbulbifer sp. ALW1]